MALQADQRNLFTIHSGQREIRGLLSRLVAYLHQRLGGWRGWFRWRSGCRRRCGWSCFRFCAKGGEGGGGRNHRRGGGVSRRHGGGGSHRHGGGGSRRRGGGNRTGQRAVGVGVAGDVGLLVAGVSLPQPASRTAAIDTQKAKGSHLDMPVRVIITPLDVPQLRSVSRVENNR